MSLAVSKIALQLGSPLDGSAEPSSFRRGRGAMSPDHHPTISQLSPAEERAMAENRAFVEALVPDEAINGAYATTAGKLNVLHAVLGTGFFKPRKKQELDAIGVVFGDALVQELGMEWVMAEDTSGRDPALVLPGTSVVLYPLEMIRHRVEGRDRNDLRDVFDGIAAEIRQLTN